MTSKKTENPNQGKVTSLGQPVCPDCSTVDLCIGDGCHHPEKQPPAKKSK